MRERFEEYGATYFYQSLFDHTHYRSAMYRTFQKVYLNRLYNLLEFYYIHSVPKNRRRHSSKRFASGIRCFATLVTDISCSATLVADIRKAFLEEIRPTGIRCFATFVLQHILPFSMELFPIFIKNYP